MPSSWANTAPATGKRWRRKIWIKARRRWERDIEVSSKRAMFERISYQGGHYNHPPTTSSQLRFQLISDRLENLLGELFVVHRTGQRNSAHQRGQRVDGLYPT